MQYVQYIQASFSPGFAQQIMPYLLGTRYHGSLDTWTVVHMTAAKFEPLIYKTLIYPHAFKYKNKNKPHGLSPRANYTDRATAASRRSGCQLLRIKGATWSAWRFLYGRILDFLDRSRYFSIKYLLSCTHESEWTPFQTHYFFSFPPPKKIW
jgi:hypothetical protein